MVTAKRDPEAGAPQSPLYRSVMNTPARKNGRLYRRPKSWEDAEKQNRLLARVQLGR